MALWASCLIILQKNYNQTCASEVSFSKFVSLVTLLESYAVFHNVRELLPSNLLSEIFLSKIYIHVFHFIFFLQAYFHDQFIDTMHDIHCFTFIQ